MLRRLFILLVLAGFLAAITQLGQAALHLLGSSWTLTDGKGPGQVLFYLLMLAGLFGFVGYIWRPSGLMPTWNVYRDPENRPRLLRSFWLGAGITLVVILTGYSLLFLIGGAALNPAALGNIDIKKIGEVLLAAIIVPVLVTTEEVIFRAILYNYLRGGQRKTASVVFATFVSAFFFAIVHQFRDFGALQHLDKQELFTGLFLLGILLALVYELSGSLLVGMGIHVSLIWSEVVRARTNIVLLDQNNRWWMGSDGDPRTSPYIWLLFVLLIVLAVAQRRRLHAVAAVEPGKMAPIYERRLAGGAPGPVDVSPPAV